MTVTLLVDGVQGKAAIYTGNDDLPFAAPTSYPERTLFHTDLPTIGIKTTVTLTTATSDFGVWSGSEPRSGRETIALYAHGQGATPYVEGVILSGTPQVASPLIHYSQTNVTLAGSVPLGRYNFVHLGADASYVYLNHLFLRVGGVYTGSWSLTIKLFITDRLL